MLVIGSIALAHIAVTLMCAHFARPCDRLDIIGLSTLYGAPFWAIVLTVYALTATSPQSLLMVAMFLCLVSCAAVASAVRKAQSIHENRHQHK